jgi:hypothetical protein
VHVGLAEPARLAVVWLHPCAASRFAGTGGGVSAKGVLAFKAFAHLVNDAGDAFVSVNEAVLRADKRPAARSRLRSSGPTTGVRSTLLALRSPVIRAPVSL